MPEFIKVSDDSLAFQNKLIEVKKKLAVEKQMYEAAKLIKVRMDKKTSVQQVENSLNETLDRINFLEEQVKMMEDQILEMELKRNQSNSTEFLDAIETLAVSASNSFHASTPTTIENPIRSAQIVDLNWFLQGQKLTWHKIDFKINELSYRLKLNENILEAEEKIIEAFKGQQINSELIKGRDLTKQRIQMFSQALKKYTSLIFNGNSDESTSAASVTSNNNLQFEDSSIGAETHFTGKLLIKITKIGGLTGGTNLPPFTVDLNLDHLANFRSGRNSKSTTITTVITGTKDPENPSAYTCYQEIVIDLVRSSELEMSVTSSSSKNMRGIFFIKLATLFGAGPDEEGTISNSFEIEPTGFINLQFHYTPDKLKKIQINKERITRIERRPAIKRTQHTIKGHELISTNFFQLLKCSYCQEMILNTSGYQCKLCKLICHKKCYNKLFEKCLYSDNKKDKSQDEEPQNPLLEEFTSKYNIPHRQKLVSVAIPSWCAHCGHILPLGRKVNYKCEECSISWHDRCDPHICKNHCGLNANILESYLNTMNTVQRKQIQKTTSSIKTSVAKAALPRSPLQSPVSKKKSLNIEDFELLRCIGKGNFGKVMLARFKADFDPNYYAIKILKKQNIIENEEFESLKTEKRIFELATREGNPFLVHLESVFQDDQRIYFVMEYINGGDLMFHIQNRTFRLDDCKFYAAQVVIALDFMHSKGILYRDLKLDNILLTKSGNIKLADYGLSKCDMTFNSKTKTFCGTPEFMAPELLLDQPYGFAVDFWAFGILLYQMLESRSPFYGNNEKETFQSILRGKLVFSDDVDKNGKSLVSKLLLPKPGDRIGIKNEEGWRAVMDHPFFADINWTAMKQLKVPVPFYPKVKSPEDVCNFDEMFTSEEVALTPYPSIVTPKSQNQQAIFAEF